MKESDIPTKLLWVDLEMTGLDPAQRIIEVAAVVTDFELNEIDSYQAIIHQSDEILDGAEDWPKKNMAQLFDEVKKSDKNEDQVRAELCQLIEKNFGTEKAVLAGNSIHQDRRFVRAWWSDVESKLHYRMLDVSTLKVWIQGNNKGEFNKGEAHRAMDDIRESIAEFKWSLERLG